MAPTERARAAPRPVRIRKLRVAGLLLAVAAIAALILEPDGSSSPDSSTSTVAASTLVPRGERPAAPSENGGGDAATGRLGLGQADGAVPDGTTVFDDDVPGVAKLEADLLDAVRRAATDAAADGVQFLVDSGWRSAEYQQRLLQEAVAKYGSEAAAARWVASPTTSAHVKGEAIDIGPSAADDWLSQHGAAYGLCQIYTNEPWHFELRPDAGAQGCPSMYADAAHDPRMRR